VEAGTPISVAFVAALTYDISYAEERNRLTTAFRLILAIPHLIVSAVWGYFAEILSVVQWFIILFTGERNKALWDLQYAYLGYYGRVIGYTYLMFDEYPEFGTGIGRVPVTTQLAYEEPGNRLTNGLRIIWAIPAIVISFFLGIALFVIVVIAWFAILFTSKHGRGFFDFALRVLRFVMQLQAYLLLMTDTYPKFESGYAAQAGTAEYWTGTPSGPPPQPGSPSADPLPPPAAPSGEPLPPPGS
jgi:Domain of unknown function (DUF4389)